MFNTSLFYFQHQFRIYPKKPHSRLFNIKKKVLKNVFDAALSRRRNVFDTATYQSPNTLAMRRWRSVKNGFLETVSRNRTGRLFVTYRMRTGHEAYWRQVDLSPANLGVAPDHHPTPDLVGHTNAQIIKAHDTGKLQTHIPRA